MRRSLTLSCIAACTALSIAAALGLQPWSVTRPSGMVFEAKVESSRQGLVQLYYDIGRDFNEADSSIRPIAANHETLVRFTLPYGRISALRLDPLDSDGTVSISGARLVGASGAVVATFPPEKFRPHFEIAAKRIRSGTLVVTTTPRATDPSLVIDLAAPILIERPSFLGQVIEFLVVSLLCVLAANFLRDTATLRLVERASGLWKSAMGSPVVATAFVALMATAAANYPVITAGKSFVSPGLGVGLLYGQSPWLPGSQSADVAPANKSDVAAVLWHHLPLSMIERKALLEDGELPLWNRYDSAGVPLLGQGQSCLGDPLHLIPILANGAAWAWDVKFLLAKWIFALGVGLCVLRSFGHLPTALLLAASSAFIGFFVYRINHPAIFSLCYSPWILYCWLRCTGTGPARSSILWMAALIGANWMEMNSGTAKEAYALLFSMNFAGLCVLLASDNPARRKLMLLGGCAGAGVIFAMISAPVWYTFYRALRGSYTSYNAPLAFQIQPGMLVGLFDEAFYRPFQQDSGVANPSLNFLMLAGLLWGLARLRAMLANRIALGLLVSSIPAFALVFGVIPPGLVAGIPFLGNILHIDNAFSCALVVILGVLSGFGLRDGWERLGSPDGRREATIVMGLTLGLFAVYFGTAQSVLRSVYAGDTWGRVITLDPFIYGYALSLLTGMAFLLGAGRRLLAPGGARAPSLILVAVALGLFHWREGFKLGGEYPGYVVRPTDREDLTAHSDAVSTIHAAQDAPSRVMGFHNDFLPGWSIVYRLEGISGPDALSNPYYRELMDTAGISRVWDWRYIIEPSETARLRPILDALGVRSYAGYNLGDNLPDARLRPEARSDMEVFESGTAWPRAYFTDAVAVYGDVSQYWSWLKSGDGRPFAALDKRDWSDAGPPSGLTGELSARTVVPASRYTLTTNTTSFSVKAPGPGVIVLTEAYEPDNFRAWVNGVRVRYIRVNHAFKGIIVNAAGTYDVKFSYWPRGFSRSLDACYVGLALLALGLGFALFRLKADPRGN